jgi:hypothetical protein
MRFIFLVLLLYSCNFCFAQNDDYPDFRSKKELFTRIQEKDIRNDVASFSMAGIDESVGKLPLKTIPIVESTPNSISFAGNNIQVNITAAPFNPAKHKMGFYGDNKYVIKIDNKGYFGDYGKTPKTAIEKVSVIVDRDTVAIPAAAYNDLYNPVFFFTEGGIQKSNNKVLLSADGHKIYIYMLKRETGGSYEVTWIIQDKKYLKRVVDFGFLK